MPALKLTAAQVPELRHQYFRGVPTRELAAAFGITPSAVHKTARGAYWKQIPGWRPATVRRVNGWSLKLLPEQVLEIRDLYQDGLSHVEIAAQFEVTPALVSYIVRRQLWKDL